jgi:hypothetical protein
MTNIPMDMTVSELENYTKELNEKIKDNPTMNDINAFVENKRLLMGLYDTARTLMPIAKQELEVRDLSNISNAKALFDLTHNMDSEVFALYYKEGATGLDNLAENYSDKVFAIRKELGNFDFATYAREFGNEDLTIKELTEIVEEVKENGRVQSKDDKDMEVVESNDGYVMNRSELSASNENQLSEKVQNGNEVIHNEPSRETTSDPARVTPNRKLETVQEKGTKEREEDRER